MSNNQGPDGQDPDGQGPDQWNVTFSDYCLDLIKPAGDKSDSRPDGFEDRFYKTLDTFTESILRTALTYDLRLIGLDTEMYILRELMKNGLGINSLDQLSYLNHNLSLFMNDMPEDKRNMIIGKFNEEMKIYVASVREEIEKILRQTGDTMMSLVCIVCLTHQGPGDMPLENVERYVDLGATDEPSIRRIYTSYRAKIMDWRAAAEAHDEIRTEATAELRKAINETFDLEG